MGRSRPCARSSQRVRACDVTDIRYDQARSVLQRVNAIEITEFDHERIEGTAWGFHGGPDASALLNRIIAVGGFAKFSLGSAGNLGSVNLESTLATAVGQDQVVGVTAGGFQVGWGLAPEVLRHA